MVFNKIGKQAIGFILGLGISACYAQDSFSTIDRQEASIAGNKSIKIHSKQQQMNDSAQLSAINAKFINNFLTQDVASHDAIISKDFVCIESNGSIISRETYLKNWATDFDNSGYKTFTYQDECIRIMGDIALIRSKTVFTKMVDGKIITGYTIYTDTYRREAEGWKCVQVQITPVK